MKMAADTGLMMRADHEIHDGNAAFRRDVLAGLARPQKAIPARWFYDERGSELFEDITRLPEYYPTAAETEILGERGAQIALAVGPGRAVVEFGAGSARKTPLLLNSIAASAYVAIDISGDFLRESCARLAERFPELSIVPVEADFTGPVHLPHDVAGLPLLGFFPGSTIGNLAPLAAIDLLRSMRGTLGDSSMLLIGFDCIKERSVLLAAYDDGAGVTAAFNRNLITRINSEIGGTMPEDAFEHCAVWNEALARIEMHLEASRDLAFAVAGQPFTMRRGETIHTENSHKYDNRSAGTLLLGSGWTPIARFSDSGKRFMVILATASGDESAP